MATVASSPAPAHRAAKSATATKPSATKLANTKKKLPEATIETTAETFLTLFKALPGAIQWRIVQKIEDYEDELDSTQLEADRNANPEDYDPKNSIPLTQAIAEYEALHKVSLSS